ncbi:TPA: hypothetical protein U2R09_000897 [Klebsiella variicola]|nr:hypothetical protein [Klebsiella variicola]
MSFEIIAGLVVVILGAIAGAFGIGHARGASKAKAKADQQRTEENAAATVAAVSPVSFRLNPNHFITAYFAELVNDRRR